MGISSPVVFPLFGIQQDGTCACGNPACTRVGKHPAVAWRDLELGSEVPRSTDGAGYGLKTGAAPRGSNVIVVDLDSDEAASLWEALTSGDDPVTYAVETARGLHLYFQHPGFRVRNSASELAKGIDIRGDGGFVVGAGSPHKSGVPYVVADDSPPAPAPAWLVEWLKSRPASAEVQPHADDVTEPAELERRRGLFVEFCKTTPPCVEGSNGDVRLFEVVQYGAFDLRLPTEDLLDLIEEHFDPRCVPPWGDELESRVLHKARSAKSGSTRPRREPPPADVAKYFGGAVPDALRRGIADAQAGRVSSLGSFAQYADEAPADLPPFPVAALPPVLRAFAEAQAEFTQVPVDLPAMLALGACAAAVAGKVDLQVAPGYVEPLNLFVTIGLATGERKSPNFDAAFAPIKAAERAASEAATPLIEQAKVQRETLEKRLRQRQSDRAKMTKAEAQQEWAGQKKEGGLAVDREIAELTEQITAVKAATPTQPRILVDDVTVERLGSLLAEQNGRLCLGSDEGTVFGVAGGRYAKDGKSSFEVLLKGYSGTEIRIDRQAADRPPVFVRRPRLSLIVAVQPSVIQGLAADPSMRSKGLLARILYSMPGSMVGSRKIDAEPVPEAVHKSYAACVRRLTDAPTPEDRAAAARALGPGVADLDEMIARTSALALDIPTIGLSTEAKAMHRDLCMELEPRLHPTKGDLVHLADWANKWAGNIARIAGVLHVAEHGANPGDKVSGECMDRAIVIGRYLLVHAEVAFGEMCISEEERDADELEAWAKEKSLSEFSARDIARLGPNKFRKDRKRFNEAARNLISRGILRAEGRKWVLSW